MAIIKSAKSMAIALVSLAFANSANAATLAGGPMYGGPSGSFANCYVINTGGGTVRFTSKTILGSSGDNVQLTGDTCGSGLAPQASCAIYGFIGNSEYYSCELTTSSSDAALRGEMEIRDSAGSVLNSGQLR